MPRPECRSIQSICSRSLIAEAGVVEAEPVGQRREDLVIGAALARRLDQLRPEENVLMAAALVDVVVLEKHRRRQHDVGNRRRLGHHLLVDADEEVLAGEAALDLRLLGRDRHRVGVLDQHRRHRRAAEQRLFLAAEDRADPRLVELAHLRVGDVEALDHRLVEAVDAAIVVEGAAALVLPGPGDAGDRGGGVHVHLPVPRPREAIAEPEEGAPGRPDGAREALDLRDARAR